MPIHGQLAGTGLATEFRSALWTTPPHSTLTTAALSTDTLYLSAFRVNRTTTIDCLGVEVTATSANTTAKMGIWNNGAYDLPGGLLTATTDLDTHTGNVLACSTLMTQGAVTLGPGTYWVGVAFQTATPAPTVRTTPTYAECIAQTSTLVIGATVRGTLTQSAVSGTLPDPPITNNVSGTSPLMFLRAV